MKKNIICILLAFTLVITTFVSCKREENKNKTDISTNPTIIETVTDEAGEVVTDTAGEVITEVYEEVPVTDSKGVQVTSDSGEKVTTKIPHTTENNTTTSTTKKQSILDAIFNPTKDNTTQSSTTTTTKPVKEEPSSDKEEIPGTTVIDNIKEENSSTTTTAPTTTKPTTTVVVPSKDINYFAQYAKEYGLSIGLTYDYEGHKDNENNGWWTPITFTTPVTDNYKISYKEAEIRGYLHDIKDMWEYNYGDPKFWIQIEQIDESHYNLYIGY